MSECNATRRTEKIAVVVSKTKVWKATLSPYTPRATRSTETPAPRMAAGNGRVNGGARAADTTPQTPQCPARARPCGPAVESHRF